MRDLQTYIHSTAADLLNDDFFLESEQHPTKESLLFWSELESKDKQLSKEIEQARTFLKSIRSLPVKTLSEDETQMLWNRISLENEIAVKKQKTRKIYTLLFGTAACLALLVVGGWILSLQFTSDRINDISKVESPAISPGDDIKLILSKEESVTIEGKEGKVQYKKDGKVDVNSQSLDNIENSETSYNQLIVPSGKRSSIIFSDGTSIQVNANTRVVYPVTFAANKREIYVEGEIFLDVYHDSNRPFVVRTNKMSVMVLGTTFNVCAYNNSEMQSVVLVDGKVQVETNEHHKCTLKPKEMLVCTNSNQIAVEKDVDVTQYTSWKDGYYKFQQEPIQNIVDKIAQYYGKQIIIDKALLKVTCSGKLDLKKSLKESLETLTRTIPAQVIENEGNVFLIK